MPLMQRESCSGRMKNKTSVLDKRLKAGLMPGNRYAYDEALLGNLKILEGDIDMEKFRQGGYVLVTPLRGEKRKFI